MASGRLPLRHGRAVMVTELAWGTLPELGPGHFSPACADQDSPELLETIVLRTLITSSDSN